MSYSQSTYKTVGDIDENNRDLDTLLDRIEYNNSKEAKWYNKHSICLGSLFCMLFLFIVVSIGTNTQKLEWIETDLKYQDKDFKFYLTNNNFIFPYTIINFNILQHYYDCGNEKYICTWVTSQKLPFTTDIDISPREKRVIKIHSNTSNPYIIDMIKDCDRDNLNIYYTIDNIRSSNYGCY